MENQLFESLFFITNFFNDPKHDTILLKKAGLREDKNLLPILVRVGMNKAIRVGDIADQLGRDHSSVSRQIDKFEAQGLLRSAVNQTDKRIREISLTPAGESLYRSIEQARRELFAQALGQLTESQIHDIDRGLLLLRELLEDVNQ